MIYALAILLILVLGAAFAAGIGCIASWVLAQFGIVVSWFVCAVAFWLISVIGRAIFGK